MLLRGSRGSPKINKLKFLNSHDLLHDNKRKFADKKINKKLFSADFQEFFSLRQVRPFSFKIKVNSYEGHLSIMKAHYSLFIFDAPTFLSYPIL